MLREIESERDERETDVVDLSFLRLPIDVWRVRDDAMREREGQASDRDVDEEDPPPLVVIRDVSPRVGPTAGASTTAIP
jgi:hypothetical protein